MRAVNTLNVYRGPDALVRYYDPDMQPPLPLVEIPDKLNPFRGDGVRIYAKMMTVLPANNVKMLPALNMLQRMDAKTSTVVEYSSGSTVISMSVVARVLHGLEDVHAYMTNKVSDVKIKMMRFFGLKVTLFGGPSQPDPTDPRGGIQRARQMALDHENVFNPNQYENFENPNAHSRWTAPQILNQLPEINVFCAGMGTAGTMSGIGTYLGQTKPSVCRVGVCTAPGELVPGPRTHALLAPVEFPWRESVDAIEEVGTVDSYRLSMLLSREGLICGPSSGLNLQGLLQFLRSRKKQGTLRDLAGDDGSIHCVFICCDLPYQYLNDYFVKLGEESFPPISGENLLGVDLYPYDDAWELEPSVALTMMDETRKSKHEVNGASSGQPASRTVLLDLRRSADHQAGHLPGAINVPLASLHASTPSPFADAQILEAQWLELERSLDPTHNAFAALLLEALVGRKVVAACYDGDTARVACSILRARSIDAYSIKGGMNNLSLSLKAAAAGRTSA